MAKKPEEPPKGAPLWVLTYGDCMSLLLCFFVMLQSYSTMEREKFNQAMASLQGALGVLPNQKAATPPLKAQKPLQRKAKAPNVSRSAAMEKLNRIIHERNLGGVIRINEGSKGVHITIGDPALFDTGKAEIKPEILPVLAQIVEVISTGNENIRVEGHTDNIPIHNPQYEDNWELSIARAMSVIRTMRKQQSIDPKRLQPVGCGEYHPVASNDTEEERALNRRVEIFIETNN